MTTHSFPAAMGGLSSAWRPRRRFLRIAAPIAQITAMAGMTWIALQGPMRWGSILLALGLFLFGLLLVVLNRSGSAELNESENRMRQIIDTSLDAVITMDGEGVIIGWSAKAEPIFGWKAGEVIGRDLAETIIPKPFRQAHSEGVKRYITSRTGRILNQRIEISALRRNGEEFPVELAIAPLKNGGEVVFSAFIRDISQTKQAETELRQAKEQAESANRAKSEFLANMSHEIRTPMNGVIGMTDLLLGSELDERQRRYASMVKSSADSLLGLINDILDFSKIEAGKLELSPTPFDLGLAVEDAVEMFAQRAQQKGLDLACHVDPSVRRWMVGDADRLRQILINLLGNALKFTQRGEVIVRATASKTPPDWGGDTLVHFSVQDSGIGIPADRMNRLFQSFSQVDASTTRQFGGTGLGLAICKQLAELMGGSIGVESKEGEGSTFWFTARLADAPAEAPKEAAAPGIKPDARGLRVLVVDANDAHRQVLKEQLESWGFNARGAADGANAMEDLLGAAAMGKPYGVTIMEGRLPDMNAEQLARQIRMEGSLRLTTLMLLCGMDEQETSQAMRQHGFAGFIAKPVRQSQLFDSIMDAINRTDADHCMLPPPPGAVVSPAPTSAGPSRKARILLADDHEINRMVAQEVLGQAGHECVAVNDGQAAVEAVANGDFDLILMDCQMPRMDGFEATGIIRQHERETKRHVPIIALTANALKGDKEKCLEAGMDGYISKPLDPDKLMQTIEAFIQNAPAAQDSIKETQSGIPAPQTPPIDLAAMLQRCGGNQAFAAKMLDKFAQQSGESLQQLLQAVAGGNASEASRVAHGLKGTAALLSAERVRALAAELETLALADQMDTAQETVEQLRKEIEACSGFIPRLVAEIAEKQ